MVTGVLRAAVARLTTPLLPDDYTHLVHPLWSARELRGRVRSITPHGDDVATIVIEPGWGFRFDYEAGQYLGVGVRLDGRWVWRSYSLTNTPLIQTGQTIPAGGGTEGKGPLLTITVKAMPEGRLSGHLVNGLASGTIVRLAAPTGNFTLPSPAPERLLFITAGTGITPVMSILRTMERRNEIRDVTLIHSAHSEQDSLFEQELRELAVRHAGFALTLRRTGVEGRLVPSELDALVPDWRQRPTWACGPQGLLDALESHWSAAGLPKALHIERFALDRSGLPNAELGGTVTFPSGKSLEIDGATTLLEAAETLGEPMVFGCRVGICHSCTVTLAEGETVDLRTGERAELGQKVQTCVSVPAGDCTLGNP